MFHFRVRDGTGWDHWAVTTRLRPVFLAFRLRLWLMPGRPRVRWSFSGGCVVAFGVQVVSVCVVEPAGWHTRGYGVFLGGLTFFLGLRFVLLDFSLKASHRGC